MFAEDKTRKKSNGDPATHSRWALKNYVSICWSGLEL